MRYPIGTIVRKPVLTLLILAVVMPWLGGCTFCSAIKEVAARPMAHEPLYKLKSGECVTVEKPDRAGSGPFYADAACVEEVSYRSTSFRCFCRDNLKSNEHTRDYIGNPDAWRDKELDPMAPGETKWSLSQGSRLHIAAINQTHHHNRPYLKRVAYRKVGDCSLAMHIYKSRLDATDLEPVIFIYGGGWSHRGALSVASMETLAPNLTDKGYIVFAPFHRVLQGSDDGPPKCLDAIGKEITADIEHALDWVLSNGTSYGMAAASKVSVVGQSSGAHLAGFLAVNHPDKVERAFLLYPPTDLAFLTEGLMPGGIYHGELASTEKLLLRFADKDSLDQIDLADPFILANSYPQTVNPSPDHFPPFFIIHGDTDDVVPVEQSTRLCEALDPSKSPTGGLYPGGNLVQSCGAGSELHIIAGANHVLDLRCFSGKYTDLIRKLFNQDLCPSGYEGSKKVRDAMVKAYSQF
jgi:acetyl esterase/lipase